MTGPVTATTGPSGLESHLSTAASAPPSNLSIRSTEVTLIAVFALVLIAAWAVTVASSSSLGNLLMEQIAGTAPVVRLEFVALVVVMMSAMMLPSAFPMVSVFRHLSVLDAGAREATVRTTVFSGVYLAVWAGATVGLLGGLQISGVMGTLSGIWVAIPGAVLIGAGIYQFTFWKRYCLTQCRTPVNFLVERWRPGRSGAARLGLDYSTFCLGCCWLLMVVVFVTGAMSILWMGAFTGLILVEKTWNRGEEISRGIGVGAIAVGALVAGLSLVPGVSP